MKFLFISVAIVCCIQFANADSQPTASELAGRSSVVFFKGTPGITDMFLTEDQELQNLFNTLTTLGGPFGASGKFSTIMASLATSIKNAVYPINALKKDFIFLIKNIDTYATSDYNFNFPTSQLNDIETNLQKLESILQDIQTGLTKLNLGANSVAFSAGGGVGGVSGTPASPIQAQINLLTFAASHIKTFLFFVFSNSQTSGHTVMVLTDFMKESLTLLDALPNFSELITSIITAIMNPTNSL